MKRDEEEEEEEQYLRRSVDFDNVPFCFIISLRSASWMNGWMDGWRN